MLIVSMDMELLSL